MFRVSCRSRTRCDQLVLPQVQSEGGAPHWAADNNHFVGGTVDCDAVDHNALEPQSFGVLLTPKELDGRTGRRAEPAFLLHLKLCSRFRAGVSTDICLQLLLCSDHRPRAEAPAGNRSEMEKGLGERRLFVDTLFDVVCKGNQKKNNWAPQIGGSFILRHPHAAVLTRTAAVKVPQNHSVVHDPLGFKMGRRSAVVAALNQTGLLKRYILPI